MSKRLQEREPHSRPLVSYTGPRECLVAAVSELCALGSTVSPPRLVTFLSPSTSESDVIWKLSLNGDKQVKISPQEQWTAYGLDLKWLVKGPSAKRYSI